MTLHLSLRHPCARALLLRGVRAPCKIMAVPQNFTKLLYRNRTFVLHLGVVILVMLISHHQIFRVGTERTKVDKINLS
jgi:hypothetical protein